MQTVREIAAGQHCNLIGFLGNITILPHGILGARQLKNGTNTQAGSPPNSNTVVVDPGGFDHLSKNGPKGAGGATKDVYIWLGIYYDDQFHHDIQTAITRPGQAKYHSYPDNKHIIHVAAPDLRSL